MQTNVLHYGDNLDILQRYIPDESVDLIYLDPPFNSQRTYNVIFKDESGRKSDAQLLAFEDTWHWGPSAEATYAYLTNTARNEGRIPETVSTLIAALRKVIGDGIFDADRFLSEIVWKRTSAHSSANRPGPVHDVILMYAKGLEPKWRPLFQPYDPDYVALFFEMKDPDGRRWKRMDLTGAGIRHGATGLPWRGIDVTAKGRHWGYPP